MTYRPLLLSQNDPRWKMHALGYDLSATIGRYGCLLTCFAMLANCQVDTMNKCRKLTGGFIPHTAYAANFDISDCAQFVKLCLTSRIYSGPVPSGDMAVLYEHLAAGHPAIIEVDWRGDYGGKDHRDNQHFVLATDDAQGLIHIYDPWDGIAKTLTPRYGSTNAKAIWRYILYEVHS